MPWRDLGPLTDLPEERGVGVDLGGVRLAVFRIGGEVFAIDDHCPHRGFPLRDGTIVAGQVRCRTHGSVFDLRSGELRRGPASCGVGTYRVEILDGVVRVEVPD